MEKIIFINSKEFEKILDEKLDSISRRESAAQKKWLRSADVRKMLNISDSTLQSMRVIGAVKSYKLGSTWFYKTEEINAALEAGKMKGGTDAK